MINRTKNTLTLVPPKPASSRPEGPPGYSHGWSESSRGTRGARAGALLLALVAASLLLARPSSAQQQPAPPPQPPKEQQPPQQQQPATPPEKPADEKSPSLDELLGITKPGDKKSDGAPPVGGAGQPATPTTPDDPSKQELDRKLSAEEAANAFREAIQQMGQTTDRISKSRDVGIVTQRLQQEVIRKLDMLVKNQQNQSSSSSSSSSSQSQSGQQQQQPNQPSSGGGKGEAQAGQGENKGEAMPPAMQQPQPRAVLDSARAAWGSLPERVREMLLQGSNDYFSSFYERMTEEYYKKLAEREK